MVLMLATLMAAVSATGPIDITRYEVAQEDAREHNGWDSFLSFLDTDTRVWLGPGRPYASQGGRGSASAEELERMTNLLRKQNRLNPDSEVVTGDIRLSGQHRALLPVPTWEEENIFR